MVQVYDSYTTQQFPIGIVGAATQDGKLCHIFLPLAIPAFQEYGNSGVSGLFFTQLKEYFCGKRRKFAVPYEMVGTEFQIRVWRALLLIPYGKVATYGEIARMINRPKAVRAVGGACHANPLPLLIPCHRVVAAGGKIGGFGGGVELKQFLLQHES